MKITKLLPLSIVLGASILVTACSGVNPVPEAEKLVWHSKDEIPEWTVLPNPLVEEDDTANGPVKMYRFTGISLRHSSERIARESAINNATMALVRFANQDIEATVDETFRSSSSELQSSNGMLSMNNKLKIVAKALMQRVQVKDIYMERWKDRGRLFFKAYALVQIPEDELIASQRMGKEAQSPEPEITIMPAPYYDADAGVKPEVEITPLPADQASVPVLPMPQIEAGTLQRI